MVLTNYEIWAADCTPTPHARLEFETAMSRSRQLNPFNLNNPYRANHLSSNGYYGFSYIVSAHEMTTDNGTDNNNNAHQSNNNLNMPNLMASNAFSNANNLQAPMAPLTDSNTPIIVEGNSTCIDNNIDFNGNDGIDMQHQNTIQKRTKKRHFVMNCNNNTSKDSIPHFVTTDGAKRCRYDDNSVLHYNYEDYTSAEYCNDFFNLPCTQIATQSCLMDTEELPQNPTPTVMPEQSNYYNNNNNTNNFERLQQQQQYQHEQHFCDGHGDVSRCLSSHMI